MTIDSTLDDWYDERAAKRKRSYRFMLARDYVAKWSIVEGVRELLQNALDSGDLNCSFEERCDGSSVMTLISGGVTLEPNTLLIGNSSKSTDTTKIGMYGEGYKLAMLVLERSHIGVTFVNGERLWYPEFVHDADMNMEVFTVHENAAEDHPHMRHDFGGKGLCVIVDGLEFEDVEAIKKSCLQLQPEHTLVYETSRGDILPGHAGELYVNGLYVCETTFLYGYDVRPEYLKLERDRQTVSNWQLAELSIKMWNETKEYDLIINMIEQDAPDMNYADIYASAEVKERVYNHFEDKHQGNVIVSSQAEADEIRARVGVPIVFANPVHRSIVASHENYSGRKEQARVKQPKDLIEDWIATYEMEGQQGVGVLLEMAEKWSL